MGDQLALNLAAVSLFICYLGDLDRAVPLILKGL